MSCFQFAAIPETSTLLQLPVTVAIHCPVGKCWFEVFAGADYLSMEIDISKAANELSRK